MKFSLRTLMIAITLVATYIATQKAVDKFRFHQGDGPTAAKLAESLSAVDENDPESDAVHNFENGEIRYLAIHGFYGLALPGINESESGAIIEAKDFFVIQGTANLFESRNHNWLNARAREYSTRYNCRLQKLKRRDIRENAG